MLTLTLLILTLSGLRALPIHRLPDDCLRGVGHSDADGPVPSAFRQGTEPSRKLLVDLNTGLVKEHVSEMGRRAVASDVPAQRNGEGWVRMGKPHLPEGFRQGTEPKMGIPTGFRQGTEPKMGIPTGFRQGTEPKMGIPAGFRQGTEPKMGIPTGFRQGTEPKMGIPAGFRQGTEPKMGIPAGFRQGTEPKMGIPAGFRQGTEPKMGIPAGFRQGTEPKMGIPAGFRQGTEPSTARVQTQTGACKGKIIDGRCYQFNPTPLAFKDAQASCRKIAPKAELASVTNSDLHSRLVSLATDGGRSKPALTWLGATVKNQRASWVDGSEWSYAAWMPGHPNVHADKPICVEMFKMGDSWWTAADCELKRASVCSFPATA
ncbi:pulmonary surfactant-associated protein D [Kryptolebias marmoratus]|uniref:pulmonary surfactant-associated protein D n=1 Tax=Kryptolebias marmoratus TaxID=37003 RepID=UPI000D52F397|nr:pulmonary surfactant-associated protein D [Kryptolebias marmoratus]